MMKPIILTMVALALVPIAMFLPPEQSGTYTGLMTSALLLMLIGALISIKHIVDSYKKKNEKLTISIFVKRHSPILVMILALIIFGIKIIFEEALSENLSGSLHLFVLALLFLSIGLRKMGEQKR